jgi:hypothetical protein
MKTCYVLLAISCLASVLGGQGQRAPTWETCSLTDGKVEDLAEYCRAPDLPRDFKEYLVPGRFVLGKWEDAVGRGDYFTPDFLWSLRQPENSPAKVDWSEVGFLGPRRIRWVRYQSPKGGTFAGLLLLQNERDLYVPLMKWAGGEMPKPGLFSVDKQQVLTMTKDFGGRYEMVSNLAWVWTPDGPVRLDIKSAIREGIDRVFPGNGGADTAMDWKTLHYHTYNLSEGESPGRYEPGDTFDLWFRLEGIRLRVLRVEGRLRSGKLLRWP